MDKIVKIQKRSARIILNVKDIITKTTSLFKTLDWIRPNTQILTIKARKAFDNRLYRRTRLVHTLDMAYCSVQCRDTPILCGYR